MVIKTVTLNPSAGPRREVTYAGITTAARDTAGNALEANKTWGFAVKS